MVLSLAKRCEKTEKKKAIAGGEPLIVAGINDFLQHAAAIVVDVFISGTLGENANKPEARGPKKSPLA
jgi:hypothetical protein